MSKTRIVCIVGATASGKTGVAVKLAKRLHSEIVSADSMQVYKHMDIGSAKPTEKEREGIVHHLMDCLEISASRYSVSEYKEMASAAIRGIKKRGMIPIVAGGTGLYINALTYPLSFAEVEPDETLRAELKREEEKSPGILHKMLTECDPVTAERLHTNDTKRLVRAIEVYRISGKPLSEHGNDFRNEKQAETEFEPIMFQLTMPREMLYRRIEKRVDEMVDMGLSDEVKRIMQLDDFSEDLPSMQGLGYKQIISHILHGDPKTFEETVDKIKMETRRFAKRQLTWFRRDGRIREVDVTRFSSADETAEYIEEIVRREYAKTDAGNGAE